jgi:hypothetical protein
LISDPKKKEKILTGKARAFTAEGFEIVLANHNIACSI